MARHADVIRSGLEIVAGELTANARRIPKALDTIADSTIGVSSAGSGQGGGGRNGGATSDPTGDKAGRSDTARDDRRRVDQLTRDLLDASRRLTAILDRYDPPAKLQAELRGNGITNDELWCPNHHTHGHREPRAEGRTYCRWCDDMKRRYGRLPNAPLIDAHSRGRNISEAEAHRLLGTTAKGAAS